MYFYNGNVYRSERNIFKNNDCIVTRFKEKKDNGENDPEIAFMGDRHCDQEGGICIGCRGGKLVGIEQYDWLL